MIGNQEIGALNRRVVIKLWADSSNADFGINQTVDVGITRWARIIPVAGLAYWNNKQVDEEITHKIVVRYGSGTKPQDLSGQHVVDHLSENTRYRIVKTTHVDDSRVFTLLECKELGPIT